MGSLHDGDTMSTLTDLAAIAGIAVGGFFLWKALNVQQDNNSSVACSPVCGSNQTCVNRQCITNGTNTVQPNGLWAPGAWFIPDSSGGLLQTWINTANNANIGGDKNVQWGGWDVVQDVAWIGNWFTNVTNSTGLRW